jgi:hypothetical protein
MKYIKLLGHYYKDGYFGKCSNDKRPIVEDITLGNPGTIRIHSDQGDTLYVYHDALSNTPEYIKNTFNNVTYTSGAAVYNALENDDDFFYPDEAEVIIIPQTNYKLNGPNEIHYDIYWPYDLDTDLIPIQERGIVYDSRDIPTYPLYTATNDGINLTTSGKVLSADDVYGLCASNNWIDALTYARPYTVNDCATNVTFYANDKAISISDIDDRLTRLENNNQTKGKENKFMNLNNLFGNLRVGKAGRDYAITYYGTVSYKGKTYYQGQIYEVDGLTLPLDYLFFVPSNTVAVGDVISKNDTAYYVTKVTKTGVEAVNLETGTVENLLAGGPFGMTMYSKLFNPMGNMVNGNIGNLLLMQSLMGDNKGGDNSLLMAMMFMGNGGLNFQLPGFTTPQAPVQEVKGSVTPVQVAQKVVDEVAEN